MVRQARLERATFWFGARNQRTFINLALGTTAVHNCALLLVIKDFGDSCGEALPTVRNAYVQGVGTKMGTAIYHG
jgi:hypothetical protein